MSFLLLKAVEREPVRLEALNRLEATSAHILGGLLTKSRESGVGYGYGGYGQHYGYGEKYGKGSLKRTEILMISRSELMGLTIVLEASIELLSTLAWRNLGCETLPRNCSRISHCGAGCTERCGCSSCAA